MVARPSSPQGVYDPVAKAFHWLTAFLVLAMLAIGWAMTDGTLNRTLFTWHKSIGVTILVLTGLRLGWRLMNPPPPLPAHMPNWQCKVAHATHWALYAFLIVMPLSGWMIVTAFGSNIVVYGLLPLPDFPFLSGLPNKATMVERLGDVHAALAFVLAGLLALHIGAALKHHFIDRDGVLLRIMPEIFVRPLQKIRNGT
jgi:cytochrome b561